MVLDNNQIQWGEMSEDRISLGYVSLTTDFVSRFMYSQRFR